MSKKMLKRSLALGALMAFVITGSAMAAEINESGDYSCGSLAYGSLPHGVSVGGTLTITSATDVGIQGYGSVTANKIVIDTHCTGIDGTKNDGDLNVSAKEIQITTEKYNGIQLNGGISTDINITGFDKLEVYTGTYNEGHGISNNGTGEINIIGNANSIIDINAAENAVYTRLNDNGTVNISAKDVTIASRGVGDSDKGHAIFAKGNGSQVIINATNNLTVTAVAGKNAVKADSNAKVSLTAGKDITIDGVVQGEDGKNSQIDLKGNNVTVTAKAEAPSETEGAVRNVSINATGKVTINADGAGLCGVGAGPDDATRAQAMNSIKAKEIDITSKGAFGVYANNHGYHTVGTRVHSYLEAETINIVSKKDGIYASNGAVTEVNGFKTLNVTSEEQGIGSEYGHLTFDGGDVVVNSKEEGIRSKLGGELKFKTDLLKVNAGLEAIKLTGNSVLNIDSKVVQLDGDITTKPYEEKNPVLNVGFNGVDSYLNGKVITVEGANTNLTFNGGTWNLTGDSTVSNVTFASGSVLNLVDADAYKAKIGDDDKAILGANAGTYAITAAGTETNLTVDGGAKLQITDIEETTYNIATGFAGYENVAEKIDIADNALLQAEKIVSVGTNGAKYYQVEVKAKEASDMAADTGMSESTAGLVAGIIEGNKGEGNTTAQQAAVDFITNANNNNSTPEAVGAAINAATKMAEAGGNSATAASIVKNVTGVTNDRLSFNCGHSAPHKGGHGVGLFEEGSGADIWVEYVHGKDEVEDMPSTAGATSYEGSYDGIVMGVDFKKVNKFQSGIAFNYGDGDTNSIGGVARTRSEYDFWGIGYYGNIHNDDSNVIFDINYAKTYSDVTQNNSGTIFEASPETTTWSAGVKLEKLYQNENVQIVPYTGLRYMSIDSDDYSTKCGAFNYSMERQDIWLLPLGVSIKQEVANDNGWTVSPRVDLSYIWAFGDTNSNMEVKSPFPGVSQIGYDVMDDGSFLGLVGIEAHKGQWGYGIAYSYQKGDHSESKKWYVDVNYSF
ncbi:MAG: autotransporter domain-containing protein [Phascolarctobacterium sp.]|nr:autotransporter domain-containing protein [Phascolarctobacterium sp.]